jgi:hypothetical protein
MTNKEVRDSITQSTEHLQKLYNTAEREFQNRKLFKGDNPNFSFKDTYLKRVRKHLTD